VDISLEDANAANFWKKYFLVPSQELIENVTWKAFCEALCDTTGTKDPSAFDVLIPYLAVHGSEKLVSMHQFNTATGWFGDFYLKEKSEATMKEIKSLIQKAWFHGLIDQGEANGRLQNKRDGVFLVRLSITLREYPYTLSLSQQRHFRIRKTKGPTGKPQLTMTNHDGVYERLVDLILGVTPILHLTEACPNKPADNPYT